jgi:hypothetical protein
VTESLVSVGEVSSVKVRVRVAGAAVIVASGRIFAL